MTSVTGTDGTGEAISTVELADHLITEFGVAHRSGYIQVAKTVREVALATGRSPGTIQTHMRRMDTLGIRVDARARLFDARRLKQLADGVGDLDQGPSEVPSNEPAAQTDGSGGHRAQMKALASLVDLVAAAPDELPAAVEIAARLLTSVARDKPDLRDERATPATPLRDTPRDLLMNNGSLTDVPINQLVDRTVRANHARPSGNTRTVARHRDELYELLRPLVDVCERLGLPAITDSDGLSLRLSPYTDTQIRFAQRKLIIEAKSGACSQPVGKLANLARDQSEDYLPNDPPPVRLTGDPAPEVVVIPSNVTEPAPPSGTAPEIDVHGYLNQARDQLRRSATGGP